MENQKQILNSLRIKSFIGLSIFLISVIGGYFYLNHSIIGLLTILGMIVGWIIFSHNHTKISSLKIQAITKEYLKDKFKR